jgi:hypothetical protein
VCPDAHRMSVSTVFARYLTRVRQHHHRRHQLRGVEAQAARHAGVVVAAARRVHLGNLLHVRVPDLHTHAWVVDPSARVSA